MRGLHICVPRDMTQAAGMYNLLLRGDEPALVIECLNGYRLKERLPANVGEFTVPLGKAEILQPGEHITVISYGSTLRVCNGEAAKELEKLGVSIEVIDPQTLHPFDTGNICATSLKKTNKLLIVDEDSAGRSFSRILLQQGARKAKAITPRLHSQKRLTAKEYLARHMVRTVTILPNHRWMMCDRSGL